MGGGIAYGADWLGKKVGKKRLSLFGLRPKHTAAVGTVLLGILITLFTMTVVLIGSKDLRQSILHGNKIREDLANLESQLKSREANNAEITRRNDDLLKRVGDTTKELKSRRAELEIAQGRLADLNTKITGLQSRITNLTSDAKKKREALSTIRKQLTKNDLSLKEVKQSLKANLSKLNGVVSENKSVLDKNAELVNKQDDLLAKQAKLLQDQSTLTTDLSKIKQEVSDLEMAKDRAQKDLDQSRQDLTSVVSQLGMAKSELDHTRELLASENKDLDQLTKISDSSREQPLVLRRGEEVTRLKVPGGVNQGAASGAITLLLRRARVAAQERGAVSAGVFDHPKMSADEIMRQTMSQLTNSPTPKVIIASSSLNAFRRERVSLELTVLPDPLVYVSGQMVAESVINANRGDAVIYQELTAFLQDKVSTKAKKDGMIPIANSDRSFGQITQSDVLQLIEQLHSANRPIRLQALAVGDTHAADLLKLEFRLR